MYSSIVGNPASSLAVSVEVYIHFLSVFRCGSFPAIHLATWSWTPPPGLSYAGGYHPDLRSKEQHRLHHGFKNIRTPAAPPSPFWGSTSSSSVPPFPGTSFLPPPTSCRIPLISPVPVVWRRSPSPGGSHRHWKPWRWPPSPPSMISAVASAPISVCTVMCIIAYHSGPSTVPEFHIEGTVDGGGGGSLLQYHHSVPDVPVLEWHILWCTSRTYLHQRRHHHCMSQLSVW